MSEKTKSLFDLSATVGRNKANQLLDVAKLEVLLGATGYLDIDKTNGPTGYFGQRLENAVEDFQKEEGLKVDGKINPNGETVNELTKKVVKSGESHRKLRIGDYDIGFQLDDEMRTWSDKRISERMIESWGMDAFRDLRSDREKTIDKIKRIVGYISRNEKVYTGISGGGTR